ncbi:MAG TPA: choice-of-anchor tandem repeat GloVer-containing protein [Verrucomicrobiae bacterium]|nr:choice-of-anchor tandem repeat GloVer-containing protein [Verrucomicrobiae bacterium]
MRTFRIPLVIALAVAVAQTFTAHAQTVTETVLHSFTGSPDGFDPVSGLVQGSDSNFYGTTRLGGTSDSGTVFRVGSDGTYTNLHSFGPSPDGTAPWAGLVQGTDSNFYGTTISGGAGTNDVAHGVGTVFRISPSGTYTSLYSFGTYHLDAGSPYGALVQGTNGNFYGTTGAGGTNLNGTVFEITPDGVETILYSFAGPPHDGAQPQAGLVLGSDGNFYGTTYFGGSSTNCGGPGCGTVFRISPDGSYSNLYSFGGYPNDGSWPRAALVEGSDGNFYGTTWAGGSGGACEFGCGTVFQITPEGIETDLHSFHENPDGADLAGALVQGSDSNFYGTTFGGGPGYGNVFRISPSGAFTNLYAIPYVVGLGAADGIGPEAGLVLGSDGDFYGTAAGGGTSANCGAGGCGVVFKLAIGSGGGTGSTNCTFSIGTKTSITLTAKGGSKTVSVKTKSADCAWSAVSNDPFITITSGASGTGSGKVVYSVPGNTNTTALTGTMTIAGETFTVNQAAGGCTFKLSPKAGKLKATGGTGTIKVTPNLGDCDWTAVSNDSFITITSGASGTGKGAVTYTVPANTNTTVVVGSITVDGQTFTVTQAGAK